MDNVQNCDILTYHRYEPTDLISTSSGGIAPTFLDSALDGSKRPGRFTSGERASYTQHKRLCRPRASPNAIKSEKSIDSAGNRTPIVHPVACLFTEGNMQATRWNN
jgi:hypothetical protein